MDVWTAVKADGTRLSPHLLSALFAACTVEGPAPPALLDTAVEAAEALQSEWRAAVRRGPQRGLWDEW